AVDDDAVLVGDGVGQVNGLGATPGVGVVLEGEVASAVVLHGHLEARVEPGVADLVVGSGGGVDGCEEDRRPGERGAGVVGVGDEVDAAVGVPDARVPPGRGLDTDGHDDTGRVTGQVDVAVVEGEVFGPARAAVVERVGSVPQDGVRDLRVPTDDRWVGEVGVRHLEGDGHAGEADGPVEGVGAGHVLHLDDGRALLGPGGEGDEFGFDALPDEVGDPCVAGHPGEGDVGA